jgi:DNA-binding CsgD family transcriptional regulator
MRPYSIGDMRSRKTNRRSKLKRKVDNRSLRVLRKVRQGEALYSTARSEGIDPRTVLNQLPNEFRKLRGHWVAAHKADRLPRRMKLLDDKGRRPGVVRGSKAASLLGRYNDALSKFFSADKRYAGNESLLKPFRGKRVGGIELLTDPKKLVELAEAGELRFGDDLYAAPSGGAE